MGRTFRRFNLKIEDPAAQAPFELDASLGKLERERVTLSRVEQKSLVTDFQQWFFQRQRIYFTYVAVTSILDAVTVTLYFVFLNDEVLCGKSPKLSLVNVPLTSRATLTQGVLGVWFLVHFMFSLAVDHNASGMIASYISVISVVTATTMIYGLVHYIVTGSTDAVWAPSYLRVWWVHHNFHALISRVPVDSAIKEIGSLVLLLVAFLVTSAGTYQLVETISRNCPQSFADSIYLMVVTVTTMGYGDVVPTSQYSDFVLIIVIFASMFFLPAMISNFQMLSEYMTANKRYSRPFEHVLVAGNFSLQEIRLILWEFSSAAESFSRLNIVVISSEPFSAEVRRLVEAARYRKRVTLCVSDPSRRNQVFRYEARRAVALFMLSPRRFPALRGDLQTITHSVSIFRHDQDLPQYVALRRDKYASSITRYASTILDRQRMKCTLMGLSTSLPCLIPLIVNLVRQGERRDLHVGKSGATHPADIQGSSMSRGAGDVGEGWWAGYEESTSFSFHTVEVPAELEGRLFFAACLTVYLRTRVTVVGVQQRYSKTILLAPLTLSLRLGDKLIVLGESRDIVRDLLAKLERLPAYRTPLSQTVVSRSHLQRPPPTAAEGGHHSESSIQLLSPVLFDPAAFGGGQFAQQKSRTTHTTVDVDPEESDPFLASLSRGDPSGAPPCSHPPGGVPVYDPSQLDDHVVVIDIPHAEPHALNLEELIEQSAFRSTDLFELCRHMKAEKAIVVLSREPPPMEFLESWPAGWPPVIYVKGSGLHAEDLSRASVLEAKHIIIARLTQGSSEILDQSGVLVRKLVHAMLLSVGREKVVNVITEIDDVDKFFVVEPLHSEPVRHAVQENYALSLAYATGGAVSEYFIDTLLFQGFFNQELPSVLIALLMPPSGVDHQPLYGIPVSRFFPPSVQDSLNLYTYGDLFRAATHRALVPLGLLRKITSSERGEVAVGRNYFRTNPPQALSLSTSDVLYVVCSTTPDSDLLEKRNVAAVTKAIERSLQMHILSEIEEVPIC